MTEAIVKVIMQYVFALVYAYFIRLFAEKFGAPHIIIWWWLVPGWVLEEFFALAYNVNKLANKK